MGIENQSNAAPAAQGGESGANELPALDSVNWGDLDVDVDGGAFVEEPVVPEAQQTPPAQQPTAQTPPAQQPQQPGQQPVQTPQQTPVASPEQQSPVQQQPQQQPGQPVQQPQPAVDAAELQRQWQAQLEQDFAINEEDALALSTAPETVMPRLAANMYQRVMQDVAMQLQHLTANLPNMLQQYAAQVQAEESAKQVFYSEWPGLAQNHDRVLANALLVRQANPNATRQQVIEMAGMMTAIALGLDPNSVRRQAGSAPAQMPQQQQMRQVQQQPIMRPAGMVPAQGAAFGDQNLFESFANEDMDWLKG